MRFIAYALMLMIMGVSYGEESNFGLNWFKTEWGNFVRYIGGKEEKKREAVFNIVVENNSQHAELLVEFQDRVNLREIESFRAKENGDRVVDRLLATKQKHLKILDRNYLGQVYMEYFDVDATDMEMKKGEYQVYRKKPEGIEDHEVFMGIKDKRENCTVAGAWPADEWMEIVREAEEDEEFVKQHGSEDTEFFKRKYGKCLSDDIIVVDEKLEGDYSVTYEVRYNKSTNEWWVWVKANDL